MASAEQLKALLQSHLDSDDERFFSVAIQVAAHEARLGHGKLAKDLRAMIDAGQESTHLRAIFAGKSSTRRIRESPRGILPEDPTGRHDPWRPS